MTKPLAIDFYCGLGGWTEGLLAEGYDVVGFDIERHEYDGEQYPAQLVLQNVLTLHGRQFKSVALMVASPPCQRYSYMAMSWSRSKQMILDYEGGVLDVRELNALFEACFRIQKEACEAAGKHIPLVVENVRGAQKWVGRARWNFGSFYLWGDVPALMPMIKPRAKVPGFRFDGSGKSFQSQAIEHTGVKVSTGASWYPPDHPKHMKGLGFNTHADRQNREAIKVGDQNEFRRSGGKRKSPHFTNPGEGIKQSGDWFGDSAPGTLRSHGSKSSARKAASARIAKIPFALSSYIARVYKPIEVAA